MNDDSGGADSSPAATGPDLTSDQPIGAEPSGQAGHDEPGYGHPAYQQPGYGQPGYGHPGYVQPTPGEPGYQPNPYQSGYQGQYVGYVPPQSEPASPSTIVLLVLSALLTFSCYFTIAGVTPLILSIIALTRQNQDPAGARKLTRIGWIVFGSLTAVIALAIVGLITAAILSES